MNRKVGKKFLNLLCKYLVLFRCTPLCFPYGVPRGDLVRPSPIACAIGRATPFLVNAVPSGSQWQHRAWTVPCAHPSTQSTRLYRSQVFGMILPWVESSTAVLAARTQTTSPLGWFRFSWIWIWTQIKNYIFRFVPLCRFSWIRLKSKNLDLVESQEIAQCSSLCHCSYIAGSYLEGRRCSWWRHRVW